eukprot:UN14521
MIHYYFYIIKNFVFRLHYQVVMLNKLARHSRFRHHQLYSPISIHGSMDPINFLHFHLIHLIDSSFQNEILYFVQYSILVSSFQTSISNSDYPLNLIATILSFVHLRRMYNFSS